MCAMEQILESGCVLFWDRKRLTFVLLEKLKAEEKNNEKINPAVKKIIWHPDFPIRLANLLNARQYWYQPLSAVIEK